MPFTINQLQKPIIRQYIPPMPARPGHPGQPYRPARWVTENRVVCRWISGVTLNVVNLDPFGSPTSVSGGQSAAIQPRYVCSTERVTFFVPEQQAIAPTPSRPATPEQTITDYQIGWNASARSVVPMVGEGQFRFRVPVSTVGAVVGITPSPDSTEQGYDHIRYGFLVESGRLRIWENEALVADLGFVPNAMLSITRARGRIVYRVNDGVVRDVPNFQEPAYLSSVLYMGGDTVDDAQLVTVISIEGQSAPMVGYAGDEEINQASGFFLPMIGYAETISITPITGEASGSFLPMVGGAADAGGYSFASGSFLPMTGQAQANNITPAFAIADGEFLPMIGSAEGVMHIVGEAEGSFLPMIGLSAETSYSVADGQFLPMVGYAAEGERPDQAIVFSEMAGLDRLTTDALVFAIVDGRFGISGLMVVTPIATATMMGRVSLSDNYTLILELQAAIRSFMEANASAFDPASAQQRDVWVYHMGSDGSTRYEGFDFDGFAKVDDAYYGIKPDGIYLLEGQDDDGEAVQSRVNFGSLSFGSMARKALPYVYVGMASSGNTFLRVTVEGDTFTYRVRNSTSEMKTHRFEPGRGLAANFYELELVADGEVFDLHAIDFQAIELKRRL